MFLIGIKKFRYLYKKLIYKHKKYKYIEKWKNVLYALNPYQIM